MVSLLGYRDLSARAAASLCGGATSALACGRVDKFRVWRHLDSVAGDYRRGLWPRRVRYEIQHIYPVVPCRILGLRDGHRGLAVRRGGAAAWPTPDLLLEHVLRQDAPDQRVLRHCWH